MGQLELHFVVVFTGIMFVRSSTKTFHLHDTAKIWHYGLFVSSDWLQFKKMFYSKTKSEKIYVGTNILCQLKNMSAMHNSCVWLAEIEKKLSKITSLGDL